jgi:hypothetical protein
MARNTSTAEYDYIRDLALAASRDEQLRQEIANDPVAALTRHQRRGFPAEDIQVFITPMLCLVVLAVMLIAVVFATQGKTPPAEVVNLGSAALGGIVGLKAGHW